MKVREMVLHDILAELKQQRNDIVLDYAKNPAVLKSICDINDLTFMCEKKLEECKNE